MSDAFQEFGPYLVYERLGQGRPPRPSRNRSRHRQRAPLGSQRSPPPGVEPRSGHSVLWLTLLMLALGAGAMAAAYYWPDL